jgi:short-subunit dehydrogenase
MKNKVVIVTGASSGIGLATAKEFARLGSKVVMAARNYEKLSVIEKEMKNLGYEALAIKTDVCKMQDCENLILQTVEAYGGIDILVNNAGISMRALFTDLDLQIMHQLMNVNFWGTVYCSKYALPYLIKAKGSLIGISSIAGFHGLPGRSGYSASKFAMHGFLETIRIENLKKGLHVMILSAGFTKSEIRKKALTANGNPQGYTPRDENKMMMPEEVAKELIRAIRKKKRNKILTIEGQLTALFQRIIPHVVDRVAYNKMAKEPESPLT